MKTSKKGKVIITVILVILGVAFGALINAAIDGLFTKERKVEIVKSKECTDAKIYYQSENFNIYTYCLDSIKVSNEEDLVELKDFFSKNIVLDNFLDDMETNEKHLNDNSTLYIDDKNDLSVLRCHGNYENEDIYIGPSDMEYDETFCKDTKVLVTDDEFTVDYKVDTILEALDKDYKYITIHEEGKDNYTTVKIKKEFIENLKVNKNYTFTFKTDNAPFENTIENIFKNSDLIKVDLKK